MDAPSPDPTTRPPVAPAELVVAGGLLALAAALLLDPRGVQDGVVVCPFRRVTGLECPACGLTRSWVHLAHGDLTASVAAHPFGVVLVVALLVLAWLVVRARRHGRRAPTLERLARGPAVLAVAALWGFFGLVRMAA